MKIAVRKSVVPRPATLLLTLLLGTLVACGQKGPLTPAKPVAPAASAATTGGVR
jgi:predicted small lipoprotein YifL